MGRRAESLRLQDPKAVVKAVLRALEQNDSPHANHGMETFLSYSSPIAKVNRRSHSIHFSIRCDAVASISDIICFPWQETYNTPTAVAAFFAKKSETDALLSFSDFK
jgi:hypothetical protein